MPARVDYAAAGAVVLTHSDQASKVYELAGDEAYTLSELAAEITHPSGQTVAYQNLPQADFKGALFGARLPEPIADLRAASDIGAATASLFSDHRQCSRLIGRPTTSLAPHVKATLRQSNPGTELGVLWHTPGASSLFGMHIAESNFQPSRNDPLNDKLLHDFPAQPQQNAV